MNLRQTLIASLASAALVGSFSPSSHAGLIGNGSDTVQAEFFFGAHTTAEEELEDSGNPPSTAAATIGAAGVDFTEGVLDGSTIHVGDTQIVITNNLAAPFCNPAITCQGSFTGFEFVFTGTNISGVRVDPSSSPLFRPVAGGLSFTATDVLVNVAGDAPNIGDRLVLDLSFPTVGHGVPEPMSLLLLGSGLIGLGVVRQRRSGS
jgi:hypothetical protein